MISVVIPVYNVEKYLEKNLSSIIKQNYDDFEIVLVNDGSTDNSLNIAKEVLAKADIEYQIINKENGGLSSARNTGLKNARGEEVVFIDSDDIVDNDFLKNLHDLLKDNDFSICNYTFIRSLNNMPEDNNNHVQLFNRQEMIEHFLKRDISFVVTSVLFKKDYLIDNDLYFNEDIKFSEDQIYIWNFIMKMNKCAYTDKKMYGYYVRETSIMNSSSFAKINDAYNQYEILTAKLVKDYPLDSEKLKMILPRWSLGMLYTSANILTKDEFMKLYERVDGRNILKKIKGIGEIKAYLLSLVSALSPGLLYKLCRRLNLNG